MKFACVIWLFAPMLTLCLSYGFAQEPGRNLYDMSFEELSKLKIMSASKSEQGLDEIPATLRIVTGTEIRERGYFTLDEVLSDLPGFQFRNIMSLNSYIFQRGIPNQNNLTLVLIDGIQTNELNSGGFYGGGQYDLNNIERIEVVYGPASVAYGTNAVSGIINIVTREAASRGGEIGTALGNFQTHRSHASYRYESRDQTLGISISAQCLQTGKANLKGIHGDNNWTDLLHIFENDYSGHIKIRYKDFTLGTDYMNKQTSTATTQTSVGTGYKDYGSLWNIQFMNNYLKYQKSLNRDWNFSATLYNRNATVMKNTIYYVCDTAQVGYYRPNNLTGLEGIFSYRPGNIFSSTSGALIEYEELAHGPSLTYSSSPELAPPEPDKPGIQRNYLISLFVEPNFRLFRYLMLSGGLRFDQSSIYNQVFTPRAGLKYARTNYSFSLLYAEAFRAPKPWDYTDGLGNPGLQPERIRSFEATASASLFEKVACEVTVYHNLLLDGFQKETSEEGYRWVNDSELKTLGAELALR
ncbi:MAG TPA: TonB-dependent receptor plug domain-containing protein, partial [Prolixibacteraceae bacterium]|nr:TonB-dependent receptor plug domain-containing protein [Prolixibacteraceae bacterium]